MAQMHETHMKASLEQSMLRLAGLLMAPFNRIAYKMQKAGEMNERPLEYAFAMNCLAEVYPLRVLDVGPGLSPWPAMMAQCGFAVTAIDEMKGYWARRILNRHYWVSHADITQPKIAERFDFVTCISTLEHIPNHNAAVRSMFRLLTPGGHMVLTFPYNDRRYVCNVYDLPGAGYGRDFPFVCQIFSLEEVSGWLQANPGRIVRQEFYKVFSGELWSFGGRIYPPLRAKRTDKHDLAAMLIEKG